MPYALTTFTGLSGREKSTSPSPPFHGNSRGKIRQGWRRVRNRAASACQGTLLICALAVTPVSSVEAQTYPARPIKLVFGFQAGSAAHTSMMILSSEASRYLGQSVVVEPRPGAGGRLGLNSVLVAPADGYTLSQASSAMLVLQGAVDPKLRLEPGKDYAPIILTADIPYVMVSSPAMPFRDLKGLLAYAKANPGKLNMSGGPQDSDAFYGLLRFKLAAGIDFLLVPFKGGPEAVTAQLGGQVDVTVLNGALKPYVDQGKMVGIATTGSQRWSLFQNLPTLKESGFDITMKASSGIVAPPATPREIILKLNEAFSRSLADAEVRKKFDEIGLVPLSTTPEEYGNLVRTDMEIWRSIIQKAGIKPAG